MSQKVGVTVKDVPAQEFVQAYAQHLKRSGKIRVPKWADLVKTATFKELSPYDPDWYYIRAASIARKVYLRGGLGVGKLRQLYGGRENLDAISLAIGDGANDVSMIQAAHVGVGISGEEGLQAARASDYSIAQFRFLQRLLLIHGRHSYRRISKVILYSFYKNIVLYIVQFWFTIFNGFSGQTFFERTTLTAYNIAWTLLPVVAVGVFDKDINDRMLFEHPQLYQVGVRKHYFNFRVFWGWVFNAVFHSLICFGFVALTFRNSVPYDNGHTIDLYSMGSVSFTCVVVTVTLKLGLETRYWTWVNHFTMWGSLVVYAIWLMVYGVFFDGTSMGADLYRSVFQLYQAPYYFWAIIAVPVICLLRDVTWKFVNRTDLPEAYHIVQELEHLDTLRQKDPKAHAHKPYTGYSFAQESGEADHVRQQYTTSSTNSAV